MSKTVSTIVLVVLGIFLSVSLGSKTSSEDIVLTSENHILFSGKVDGKSVAEAQIQLGRISKNLGKNETIYLVLDTPGGSVSDGNLFIDFAKSLPQKIKPICLFCASMGYHMFQSFNERLVFGSSTLMSHRASLGGMGGQVPGELVTRLNAIITTLGQMDEAVAKRIGTPVEDYRKLIHDELWLDGKSAVKLKHADRIAKITCSTDIVDGFTTRTEEVPGYGLVEMVFSKCPLISGMISYSVEKKNLTEKERTELLTQLKKIRSEIRMTF